MTPVEYAIFIYNTYGEDVSRMFFDNLVKTDLDLESDFWYAVADELFFMAFKDDPIESHNWIIWEDES